MKSSRIRSIHDARHKKIVSLLIKARIDAGLSQMDLARGVGLKQPDISKIENNERRLDFIEFLSLLEYMAEKSQDKLLVKRIIQKLLETKNE